jgi:PAS domain-containing protein
VPALPETTEFLAALNAAPVLMWLSDAHHSAVHFNHAWLDYTGRSLAQELGEGWQRGVHPDDLPGFHAVKAGSDQTATVVAEYRPSPHLGGR